MIHRTLVDQFKNERVDKLTITYDKRAMMLTVQAEKDNKTICSSVPDMMQLTSLDDHGLRRAIEKAIHYTNAEEK